MRTLARLDANDKPLETQNLRRTAPPNGREDFEAYNPDSPSRLSSADYTSSASHEQSLPEAGFRQARSSRRSRDPSPQVSVQSTTDAAEQEDAASSIVTLDDSIVLLHRWTAGVEADDTNGARLQAAGKPQMSYREMLLQSKALDICLERCATFYDLSGIEQPFLALLSALGGLETQGVTRLGLAILRVAERFPVSDSMDSPASAKTAMHGALASLKAFIADNRQSLKEVQARFKKLRQRCLEQEARMDMNLSIRELQNKSNAFLATVSSRLDLEKRPDAILNDINSLERLLSKELEDSKITKHARKEQLQQESFALATSTRLLHLQLEELERRVSDVKAEIARNKARQQRIAGIMAGHHTEPSIPTTQLERQLAAIVQLKDAVELVLPSSVGAGAHQLPAMAGQGPELEALAAADFVEHCLTAHNAVIQKVILRGQALAGRMQRRKSEIQVLLEIGVKGNALGVLQEGLAKEEKEMEELVAKAKVLHSAGESALALAKAHLPLAPAERLEELEKLQGFIRVACQQMVSGPQAFAFEYTRAEPVMEKGGKSKRGPRKPRAQDANGNDAAAAGKPTAEATAPEGKRGRAPEKPRAARNPRGPTVEDPRAAERAKLQAAKEKARAELASKGRMVPPSAKPPVPRAKTVANGAAHAKLERRPVAPAVNPWEARRLKALSESGPEQLPNGHAAAPAAAPPAAEQLPAAATEPTVAAEPVVDTAPPVEQPQGSNTSVASPVEQLQENNTAAAPPAEEPLQSNTAVAV